MLARPVIFGSVTFSDPVLPSTCNSAPSQAKSPARVTTKEGTTKRLNSEPWGKPIAAADRDRGGDRQVGVPAVFDVQHRHHRRREPADGADREVDLPEQQDVDDADRDQPDRGDLQHQVGQVLGREEAVFLDLEDDRDHDQAEDHPDRGEVSLDEPAQGLGGSQALRPSLARRSPRVALILPSSSARLLLGFVAAVAEPGDRGDHVLLGRLRWRRSRRPSGRGEGRRCGRRPRRRRPGCG